MTSSVCPKRGRDRACRDQLRFNYQRNDSSVPIIPGSNGGLGIRPCLLPTNCSRLNRLRRSVALRTGIKLPTGSSSRSM